MTELTFAERYNAELCADPAYRAADQLRRIAAEREVVLYSEPWSRKARVLWEQKQQRAFEKDWAAFKRLAKAVPTTAAGAIHLIDTFLEHSMGQDSPGEALDVLENVRDYLRAAELKAQS